MFQKAEVTCGRWRTLAEHGSLPPALPLTLFTILIIINSAFLRKLRRTTWPIRQKCFQPEMDALDNPALLTNPLNPYTTEIYDRDRPPALTQRDPSG